MIRTWFTFYWSHIYFDEAITSKKCHFWAKPKAIQKAFEKVGDAVNGTLSEVGKAIPEPVKNFANPIANQGVIQADTAVNTIAEILPDNKNCTEQTCTVLGLDTFEFEARGVFYVKTNDKPEFCGKYITNNI